MWQWYMCEKQQLYTYIPVIVVHISQHLPSDVVTYIMWFAQTHSILRIPIFIFTLLLSGQMAGVGLWLPYHHLDMEPTLQVLQYQ